MLTWQEIEQKYKDEWVAINPWEEDKHGDVVRGEVVFHSSDRKSFYAVVKDRFADVSLAIRFTGDVQGPFLF